MNDISLSVLSLRGLVIICGSSLLSLCRPLHLPHAPSGIILQKVLPPTMVAANYLSAEHSSAFTPVSTFIWEINETVGLSPAWRVNVLYRMPRLEQIWQKQLSGRVWFNHLRQKLNDGSSNCLSGNISQELGWEGSRAFWSTKEKLATQENDPLRVS